jgi:cytochrome P450
VSVQPFDPFELQDTILGDVRDPFPALAEAARRGSVQSGGVQLFDGDVDLDIDPGAQAFTVYSHDGVAKVLRDSTTFSSSIVANIVGPVMGRTLLEMGGDEHRAHRALVSLAFRQTSSSTRSPTMAGPSSSASSPSTSPSRSSPASSASRRATTRGSNAGRSSC